MRGTHLVMSINFGKEGHDEMEVTCPYTMI